MATIVATNSADVGEGMTRRGEGMIQEDRMAKNGEITLSCSEIGPGWKGREFSDIVRYM